MSKKSDEIENDIWDIWNQIQDYAKIRGALALGSKSGIRDSAEGALNRTITKKVNELSAKILEHLKD